MHNFELCNILGKKMHQTLFFHSFTPVLPCRTWCFLISLVYSASVHLGMNTLASMPWVHYATCRKDALFKLLQCGFLFLSIADFCAVSPTWCDCVTRVIRVYYLGETGVSHWWDGCRMEDFARRRWWFWVANMVIGDGRYGGFWWWTWWFWMMNMVVFDDEHVDFWWWAWWFLMMSMVILQGKRGIFGGKMWGWRRGSLLFLLRPLGIWTTK